MSNKIFAIIVTVVAVILAISANAVAVKQGGLHYIVVVHRFFDVVLPTLGIGALLKFLFMGCPHHKK